MKLPLPASFRGRIFLALALVSVVPTAILMAVGTLAVQEAVISTGSAGAWDEVARSGQALFEEIRGTPPVEPRLDSALTRHEAALAESVRFSRVYAFLAERVRLLLPMFAVFLIALAAALSLIASNWLARGFSRPVTELVGMTRALASGQDLPAGRAGSTRGAGEFNVLRDALRTTANELRETRALEIERARTRSWAEMARTIAHELKNPLTPMAMAAARVSRADDPGVAEAGEVLTEEIRRLDDLARTFAEFGRPPEGPRASIDLCEMILTVVAPLEAHGIPVRSILPEEAIELEGHLNALERALRNLLSNAVDAVGVGADADGALSIEVEVVRLGDEVEIVVRDRGPGIPDEIMDRIWEPEFTRKRRGSGLGLPMVRQAALLHGGEVRAHNRPGGGAEFAIRLPLGPRLIDESVPSVDHAPQPGRSAAHTRVPDGRRPEGNG